MLASVGFVGVHAPGTNVLMSSTPHNAEGVVLGADPIHLEGGGQGVVGFGSQGLSNVVLYLSIGGIIACTKPSHSKYVQYKESIQFTLARYKRLLNVQYLAQKPKYKESR